jgi:hypothetical protein
MPDTGWTRRLGPWQRSDGLSLTNHSLLHPVAEARLDAGALLCRCIRRAALPHPCSPENMLYS